MRSGAVAFTLAGDFTTLLGICHGCATVGISMSVTASEGNRLMALNGRPAASVWEEFCGGITLDDNHITAIAVGVPVASASGIKGYLMRAAYEISTDHGVILGTHIPVGTEVMLHHRSVADLLRGSEQMAVDLKRRLDGKIVRAAIGFECGARAKPFLGTEGVRDENIRLQQVLNHEADWVGMLAWGEIFPMGDSTVLHNYAFPLLVIAD